MIDDPKEYLEIPVGPGYNEIFQAPRMPDKCDHPEIPIGPYCYVITGIETDVYGPHPVIRKCPHWKFLGGKRARCNLLDICDDDDGTFGLLWDQVKECNFNMGDEDAG